MPRPSGGVSPLKRAVGLIAPAGLVIAASMPAVAATVTDVADGAQPDKAVSFNVDLRYRYNARSSTITREQNDANGIFDASELNYSRSRHTIDATFTLGIFQDLELHFVVPYVVSDSQTWGYASVGGASVEEKSSIQNNNRGADGETIANPRPLMTVPATIGRSGIGDPTLGFTWGIFNEARQSTLPDSWYPKQSRTANWVVGFDYTMPLAPAMDPLAARNSIGRTSTSLPVGQAAHRFDFWTAMSKRVGFVEPFFKIHYTLPVAAGKAFDNCYLAANGADGKPVDPDWFMMTRQGHNACDPSFRDSYGVAGFWADRNRLEPSHVGGILLGTEFHPIDKGPNGPALHITLQFAGDYVSNGRNYSDLSDVLGKLTYTNQHFVFDGRLAVDYRFSKYVHWYTYASVGTATNHFLTNEVVGVARSSDPRDQYVHLGEEGKNEVNPSYDFRFDAPGGRFKSTAITNWSASTMLSLNF